MEFHQDDHPPRPTSFKTTAKANPVAAPVAPVASPVAANVLTVTDTWGRTFKVKKMKSRDRMQMARILGNELAKNEVYAGYAMLASTVVEFDGEAVAPMHSAREIEFMVTRLDDEGLEAIAKAYVDAGWANSGVDTDELKN